MKTKKKDNPKFNLEKFEIAKLTNLKTIVGGKGGNGGPDLTSEIDPTAAGQLSTVRCGFPVDPGIGLTTTP